ncbi:hypothetical protein D3C80_1152850 [compost metagenome]
MRSCNQLAHDLGIRQAPLLALGRCFDAQGDIDFQVAAIAAPLHDPSQVAKNMRGLGRSPFVGDPVNQALHQGRGELAHCQFAEWLLQLSRDSQQHVAGVLVIVAGFLCEPLALRACVELLAQVVEAFPIDALPFLHDPVQITQCCSAAGDVHSLAVAALVAPGGVPDTLPAMVKKNGRRNGGLINVGGYVRVVFTGPPHRISLSYFSIAGVLPPAWLTRSIVVQGP